ncbi:Uncharacterised protein [Burkholderia pseudomallei]|nr:Uncharacterised protein [Burkholderia pseudomallei]
MTFLTVFCAEVAKGESDQIAHQFQKTAYREAIEWIAVGHRVSAFR